MEVIVNAAMSADGKLSTIERRPVAISGPEDFARVDRLRAGVDAVLVGVGTVLADDPHLTVDDGRLRRQRSERGDTPQPARVVADSTARTPPTARVLDDAAETFILVSESAPNGPMAALRADSTTVIPVGDDRVDLARGLSALEAEGIHRILVEGGGELLFSIFEAGLVDELQVFVGPRIIGGADAPTLVDGPGFADEDRFPTLQIEAIERVDGGVLLRWTVDG